MMVKQREHQAEVVVAEAIHNKDHMEAKKPEVEEAEERVVAEDEDKGTGNIKAEAEDEAAAQGREEAMTRYSNDQIKEEIVTCSFTVKITEKECQTNQPVVMGTLSLKGVGEAPPTSKVKRGR